MSTPKEALEQLGQCVICDRTIGSHHADGCKHWGQVLPSECRPGFLQSAINEVLAKRELDEKFSAAREEQREACARHWNVAGLGIEDAIRATPLTFEPLRIRIEEQKRDLEQAAKVTEELVDGLAEETRKRQVAEVELAKLQSEQSCGHPGAARDRSVETGVEFCRMCRLNEMLNDALTMEQALKKERDAARSKLVGARQAITDAVELLRIGADHYYQALSPEPQFSAAIERLEAALVETK